jgi:hypothetical protein
MNFLRSCHTVNFEMDLNQLVVDITIKERCVCECMIVFRFDFGGFG